MKYMNIVYFVFAVFILGFGIATLVSGSGKLWANLGIILIGLYFLYRGVALTVNKAHAAERERLQKEDSGNDSANV